MAYSEIWTTVQVVFSGKSSVVSSDDGAPFLRLDNDRIVSEWERWSYREQTDSQIAILQNVTDRNNYGIVWYVCLLEVCQLKEVNKPGSVGADAMTILRFLFYGNSAFHFSFKET